MIAERDIAVWIVSALLALGVGWSRYAKWRTRDKLVRELAAMDPERRRKSAQPPQPQARHGSPGATNEALSYNLIWLSVTFARKGPDSDLWADVEDQGVTSLH